MNCETCQQQLSEFFDDRCAGDTMTDVFDHLYTCRQCQTFWQELIEIRAFALQSDDGYPAEVDSIIRGLRRPSHAASHIEVHFRLPRFALGIAAALFLIIAFASGYFLRGRTSDGNGAEQMFYGGLPARVVYVYAIPGTTVYANEETRTAPKELKSIEPR